MYENCIGVIGSVQDFIWEIKLLNMGTDTEHQLFYRGQNDTSFGLAPSIFRDGRLDYESKIFSEILVNCPEEFISHKTPFEKLTKMQHYELPTRLLDITSNPLVALYFASSELASVEYYKKMDDETVIDIEVLDDIKCDSE